MSGSSTLVAAPGDILTTSPLPHLRRLSVTVNEAEVVITGQVPSFYLKQLAQETIRPTIGPRRILNRVEVCQS
jgi:hypothetical protein